MSSSVNDFITKNLSLNVKSLNIEAFFLLMNNFNFASDFEAENPLAQKPIYSAGAGLSFETYYDRVLKVYAAYNGNFNFVGFFVDYRTPIYKKF